MTTYGRRIKLVTVEISGKLSDPAKIRQMLLNPS